MDNLIDSKLRKNECQQGHILTHNSSHTKESDQMLDAIN